MEDDGGVESATPGSAFSDRVNEQLPPALTTRQDFALIVADEDGVEPGDVIQGQLSDCWCLGALSELSEL